MRKIILFTLALIISATAYSQTGNRRTQRAAAAGEQQAFETKRSILFENLSLDEFVETRWDEPGFNHINFEERFPASGGYIDERTRLRLGYIEQIEFAYNERGNITTRLTRDTENRQKSRVTFQYNPQNLLFRESVQEVRLRDRRPPEFFNAATYEYTYDSNGNRIRRVYMDRTNNQLAETTYTYNAQNKLTRSETKVGGNIVSSTVYSYDGDGNLVREEVRNAADAITARTNITWQNGRETSRVTIGADGKANLQITNEYSEDGQLSRRTIENIQGESKQIVVYEYTFRPIRR